ncbi:MAG: ribulose-phosphate 3-epimerase [Oscillospiraceae bacterium]|nr:ribulose-phosphate 3-epimerase [Oscillospiraceae bacterium]
MKNQISASILNADLLHLEEVVRKLEAAKVDMLHFDVMDGVFVNNISFGIPILSALSEATSMYKDVHLMITDPLRYVDAFAKAGADMITFHLESESNPMAVINAIHSSGCKAGISIKPATPADTVFPFLDKVDMVLVMTVEPGFGGQGFIHEMTDKISEIRREADKMGLSLMIEVDGGINHETAPLVWNAGSDVFVVGSYLFRHSDLVEAVNGLRFESQEAVKA